MVGVVVVVAAAAVAAVAAVAVAPNRNKKGEEVVVAIRSMVWSGSGGAVNSSVLTKRTPSPGRAL